MLNKSVLGTIMRVISVGINFLFGIVYANLFGAADFGTFVFLQSIATIVTAVITFGLPTLLTRELASYGGSIVEDSPRALAFIVVVQLAVISVLVGAIIFYGLLFGAVYADNTSVVLVSALIFANSVLAFVAATFIGRMRVLQASVITDLLRPTIALLCLLASFGLAVGGANQGMVAHVVAGGILVIILGGPLVAEFIQARDAWLLPEFWRLVTNFLAQSTKIALAAISITLSAQIDILVIKMFEAPDSVAHYFAAARLAIFVSFFFGIYGMYAEPVIVRLLRTNEYEATQRSIWFATIVGFSVAVASGLGIIGVGNWFLGLYGASFQTAYTTLIILVVGQILWTSFGPAQMAMRAAYLDTLVVKSLAMALVVNLAVTFLLVPLMGIAGAAVGTSLQFFIAGLLMSRSMFKHAGIRTTIWNVEVWRQGLRQVQETLHKV